MSDDTAMKARAEAAEKVSAALQEYVNAGRAPDDARLITDWSLITAMTHPDDNMTAYRMLDSSPSIHESIGLHHSALKMLDDIWEGDND
ncbi:hypothetical protein [Paeniglutamicibacter terrestris]|uniref:Uncharacterized protein n=1 Tax=Paeniglutamicibacter terrestris TaxID=2723403 RepID=A0ABX1G4C2_9MICC|nr:hypothetical protein [Paeniglutamicibacter terrestris]NKG21088.1 hypothetical protein [Paeniglutamicibacter terrestris]